MDTIIRLVVSSLESGSIYALGALAIIIIFRTSVMVNFSQGVIGMFTAYVAAYLVVDNGKEGKFLLYLEKLFGVDEFPLWASALTAMVIAILLGILLDVTIIRQAKKSGPDGQQIITLGLIILLLGITPLIFGNKNLQYDRFITEGSFSVLGTDVSYNFLLTFGLGIGIMLGAFFFLQKTKWGLAVRVTAANEKTATLMGVPTKYITMGAWGFAAALSTLAALMLAPTTDVSTFFMHNIQIIALVSCVLGGFQTFYGPVLGAYIIGLSNSFLEYYVSSSWAEPILYALILIFIVIRPQGLVGKKIIKKV